MTSTLHLKPMPPCPRIGRRIDGDLRRHRASPTSTATQEPLHASTSTTQRAKPSLSPSRGALSASVCRLFTCLIQNPSRGEARLLRRTERCGRLGVAAPAARRPRRRDDQHAERANRAYARIRGIGAIPVPRLPHAKWTNHLRMRRAVWCSRPSRPDRWRWCRDQPTPLLRGSRRIYPSVGGVQRCRTTRSWTCPVFPA